MLETLVKSLVPNGNNLMNRDNQQRILWIEERSTTIESIAKKKDLSEEVSRVHLVK